MAWIKSVGCDCDCGPDPCTDGCCILSESYGGSDDTAIDFDVTGQVPADRDFAYAFLQEESAETLFEIYADGVLIYSAGCVPPGILESGTVSIPAGTSNITIVADPEFSCAAPHTPSYYTYVIECA